MTNKLAGLLRSFLVDGSCFGSRVVAFWFGPFGPRSTWYCDAEWNSDGCFPGRRPGCGSHFRKYH